MSDNISMIQLLERDKRYPLEAYKFVRRSLDYATQDLNLGDRNREVNPLTAKVVGENHLTGQELCEAIRQFAAAQYGLMAKSVLNNWGIRETGDFGNIVYNLIDIGVMKKSPNDQREHFDNVYDFQEVFVDQFEIKAQEA